MAVNTKSFYYCHTKRYKDRKMHFPTIYAALLSAFVHTALSYDADFTVYPNPGMDFGDIFLMSRAQNANTFIFQTAAMVVARASWAVQCQKVNSGPTSAVFESTLFATENTSPFI